MGIPCGAFWSPLNPLANHRWEALFRMAPGPFFSGILRSLASRVSYFVFGPPELRGNIALRGDLFMGQSLNVRFGRPLSPLFAPRTPSGIV